MSKKLLKSTFLFSFMTLISRVTGFLRDLVFARVFGASAGLDVFIVTGFRIPNCLRALFAEGAFSQAFIPILAEYREKSGDTDVKEFLNKMAGTMIMVLFFVTIVLVVVAPLIVWIFVPGYVHDPSRFDLAKIMLRVTFPYLLFISLTAYAGGILNSYGKFGIPAFTPNLLNFALIIAAIFWAPHFKQPAMALAWGVFFGGLAQLLFQLPFLLRLNLLPWPLFFAFWKDIGVMRVFKLMLPAIFGVSVSQISLFVDNFFASFLRVGSVTWLYLSSRLTYFPLGVFGVAVATVVLPHLSRKYASNSLEEFSAALDWGLRFVLIIALPAMLGLMILSGPILITLMQYGKFTPFDVHMAQRSLITFSFGIPTFMLVKVLASGFYSRQNIAGPVRVAIVAVIINIVLNALLIKPFAHAGLALATSIASWVNASILLWLLTHNKYYLPGKGWSKFLMQLAIASTLMALFLWFYSNDLSLWLTWNWLNRAWHLIMISCVAIVIYFATLWIAGMRWKDFVTSE